MTVLLALATIAVAIPALLRGSNSTRVSMVVLGLVVTSTGAVLIARHADLSAKASTRRLLAVGIGAAGMILAAAAAVEPAITGGGIGPLNMIAIVTAIAVIGIAWPLAGWLVRSDNLHSIASKVVRPLSGGHEEPDTPQERFTVTDGAIVGTGVIALIAGLLVVLPSGPFGHDESIYALKAREWIADTPATGWAEYRPIGMSVVGWVVLQFSSSEVWFRVAAVVLSTATIITMWVSGRVMFSRATATVGAAVFMSTESFLRRATEFLNDVIAAGLMLAAMTVIWVHFERSPTRWWLVAAAPLGVGAYYMRYGSALGLVIIAVVSAAIWWRYLVSAWKQIGVTAAATVLLLVPHFIQSRELTGSVLGIFESARTSVGGGGDGLADYIRWLPGRLAGPVGTALLAMGLLYAAVVIIAAVRARSDLAREARTVGFTTATALLLAVALGAFTHGEPRFLFLPLMLALLTGSRAITLVWMMLRRPPRIAIAVAAGLVLAIGFTAGTLHMGRGIDGITNSRDVLVDASNAAKEAAAARTCEVRSSYIPQITWYAECSTYGFTSPLPQLRPAFLMLFENGKRQPDGADLDNEVGATDSGLLVLVDDPYDKIGDGAVFEYP
ncbi:MAG: ArnT family glycosyltransferase [Acidimicrobiia bacterium]